MSKPDTWMPLYIGDYLADTMHLRTQEHGAYFLLLCHYWRNGAPPDDDAILAHITLTSEVEWKKIATIIRPFFKPRNGRLYQGRMEAELKRWKNLMKKRVKSGRKGGLAKAAKRETNQGAASKCQIFAMPLPANCQKPLPLPLPRKKEDNRSLRSLPQAELEGFDAWWNEYPRKVGKDAARKAYAAALKRGATDGELLIAIRCQRWQDNRKYIPHPATWLNGGRWQDDPTAAVPSSGIDQIVEDWNLPRLPA